MEISPLEMLCIEKTERGPVQPIKGVLCDKPVKVIIDTDLGTDLDDSLAILSALNNPDIEILGITTNYGPSELRTMVIKLIVNAFRKSHPEYPQIPIITGASCLMGTHREVFLCGSEGLPFFSHKSIEEMMDFTQWPSQVQTNAANFIIATAMRYPKMVKIVSIGIPTNIGIALQKYPPLSDLLKEIVIMGGGSFVHSPDVFFEYSTNHESWSSPKQINPPFGIPQKDQISEWIMNGNIVHLFPNHNLSGDTLASKIMCSYPNLPLKIIHHDMTRNFWLKGKAIDHLREMASHVNQTNYQSTDLASGIVGHLMLEWFARRHGQNGQCPHDPLTLHEAIYSGDDAHIDYVPGTFIVHEWAAFSTFIPNPNGKHLFGIRPKNIDQYLEKLTNLLTKD